jgi:hypothetical protein
MNDILGRLERKRAAARAGGGAQIERSRDTAWHQSINRGRTNNSRKSFGGSRVSVRPRIKDWDSRWKEVT